MNWILCYLNPHDYVIYKSDVSEASQSAYYYKFIEYVHQYVVDDYKDFLENLNRYFTLLIDTNNRTWEIYRKEYKEPSFEELYTINETRKKNKNEINDIQLYKNKIESVFNNKHGRTNRNGSHRRENIRSFFSRLK